MLARRLPSSLSSSSHHHRDHHPGTYLQNLHKVAKRADFVYFVIIQMMIVESYFPVAMSQFRAMCMTAKQPASWSLACCWPWGLPSNVVMVSMWVLDAQQWPGEALERRVRDGREDAASGILIEMRYRIALHESTCCLACASVTQSQCLDGWCLEWDCGSRSLAGYIYRLGQRLFVGTSLVCFTKCCRGFFTFYSWFWECWMLNVDTSNSIIIEYLLGSFPTWHGPEAWRRTRGNSVP